MTKSLRQLPQASTLAGALLLAGLPIHSAIGQLQIAENLLISVDAATFNTGDLTWTNSGTLSGNFTSNGTPTVQIANGQRGVFVDGGDFFVGPTSPDGIEANGTSSVEVWAYQGGISPEESLVTWGRRGVDHRNMSFNYGTDDRWGAVGHWGSSDIGWGPNDPVGTNGARAPGTPIEGQWHHLTYTFDGTVQRVYKNAVLMNQENVPQLNIHPDFSINLGAQRSDVTPFGIDGGNRFSGLFGKARVHDGVLSDAQILNNFNLEKAAYGRVDANTYNKISAQIPALPRNRYTFNNLASGADGTVVPDVISGQNGVIRGPGATVTPTGVDLPGGAQTQAYIDLPNGIVSGLATGPGYTSASYEAWVTVQSNQNWSRIMDFGSSANAEVLGPGGAGNGTNYFFLGPNNGTNNVMVLDRGGDAAIGGSPPGAGQRQTPNANMLGTEMHVLAVYDDVLREWRWYQNGALVDGFDSIAGPSTINDVNNWLGRSQWGGDANTDAIFNEFRIYDYALNQAQAEGNFQAGPNVVNIPEPSAAAFLGFASLLGLTRRRRRD